MILKLNSLLAILIFFALLNISAQANIQYDYAAEFKHASFQACDKVFHRFEDTCNDMICLDLLMNLWGECWKKSMNSQLDQRLLKLKNTNNREFYLEISIQKSFNLAVQQQCKKTCGADIGTLKGIPYNSCRVDAYKYRTSQAMQINKKKLTIPSKEYFVLAKSRKKKIKYTYYYEHFAKQVCKMPSSVWKNQKIPVNCSKKILMELNTFEFINDICDLS